MESLEIRNFNEHDERNSVKKNIFYILEFLVDFPVTSLSSKLF